MRRRWYLIVLLFATPATADPVITINTPLFPWDPSNYSSSISGRVTGLADPTQFVVAPLNYIDGVGWTSKPYWEDGTHHPYVPLNADGTWTAPITTGGLDPVATGFVAAVYPKNATIPSVGGVVTPPVSSSLAWTYQPRYYGTTINWSQQDWMVKTSCNGNGSFTVGPGVNRFTDDSDYVWKDASNKMHLEPQRNAGNIPLGSYPSGDGNFYSAEIVTKSDDFGFGLYAIETSNPVNALPAIVTQGSMFTWCELGNGGSNPNKEIDTAELGRWGNAADLANIQNVVQPYTHAGNIRRFTAPNDVLVSTMNWQPTYIDFTVKTKSGTLIDSWRYSGPDIPVPGGVHIHLNGWYYSAPAADQQATEMIFDSFSYVPTLVWTGSVNGTWDASTANFSGIPSRTFSDGNYVTFDNTGSHTAITIAAGGVAPGSVVFTNTTATSYSLSGGPIRGATSLVVSGGGRVTLSSTNTYTGGTMVTDGTLVFAGVGALPPGSNVTVDNSAVVMFDSGYGGPISAVGDGPEPEPVPEPCTLALLAVAAIGILARAWLRLGLFKPSLHCDEHDEQI